MDSDCKDTAISDTIYRKNGSTWVKYTGVLTNEKFYLMKSLTNIGKLVESSFFSPLSHSTVWQCPQEGSGVDFFVSYCGSWSCWIVVWRDKTRKSYPFRLLPVSHKKEKLTFYITIGSITRYFRMETEASLSYFVLTLLHLLLASICRWVSFQWELKLFLTCLNSIFCLRVSFFNHALNKDFFWVFEWIDQPGLIFSEGERNDIDSRRSGVPVWFANSNVKCAGRSNTQKEELEGAGPVKCGEVGVRLLRVGNRLRLPNSLSRYNSSKGSSVGFSFSNSLSGSNGSAKSPGESADRNLEKNRWRVLIARDWEKKATSFETIFCVKTTQKVVFSSLFLLTV